MAVANLLSVAIVEGDWKTRDDHDETQTCVAQVDVEIWVDGAAQPYVRRA